MKILFVVMFWFDSSYLMPQGNKKNTKMTMMMTMMVMQSFSFSACDCTHIRLHTRKLIAHTFHHMRRQVFLQFSININFACSHDCLSFSIVTVRNI